MTTSVRDTIRDWIHEMQTDVEQEGGLAILGLVHHNGQGQEVPIHAISSKAQGGGKWGNADALADLFDACAARHAMGCVGGGAQQFTIHACFGTSGKPTRMIPFGKMGLAHHGGIAGGGLGSEPATGAGAMSQGMRLLEIHAQGNFGLTASLAATMTTLMEKLSTRLDVTEKRSDERWLALQNLLVQWQTQAINSQFRALGVEAARKLMPLLPAAVSTITGSDVLVSQKAVEDSLFDTLIENYSGEQLQEILGAMPQGEAGGALTAVVADQLVRAKKRKEARDKERREAPERTYEQAEDDAAGQAIRALKGESLPNAQASAGARIVAALEHRTNGHAQAETPKTAASGSMDADMVLSTMLETLNDGEIDAVATMFAAKRPDVPGLKDEITRRYAAAKGKAT